MHCARKRNDPGRRGSPASKPRRSRNTKGPRMKLQKDPDRLGLGFWLPASLANGALVVAVFGGSALFEGEEWVRTRFHMSTVLLLSCVLVASLSLGVIVGLLNPYVTSRTKVAGAGATACLPTAIFVVMVLGTGFGPMASLGLVVFVASLVGGLGGAVMYMP